MLAVTGPHALDPSTASARSQHRERSIPAPPALDHGTACASCPGNMGTRTGEGIHYGDPRDARWAPKEHDLIGSYAHAGWGTCLLGADCVPTLGGEHAS